jgi:hypothetical protein
MVARFLVSATARRGYRTISAALYAAASSPRAALVEIEPGHYQETLTIRGEVELAVTGGPGSVVVSQLQGSVVDALGAVRITGLTLVGRQGDAVCCHGGTLTIENTRIQGHSGVSVHARAVSSVTLRDSVIEHGRTVFAGATGLVERCRFTDAADNAIAVIEGADVSIRDSWVSNSRIHGIRVSGARARITGCELTGTGNSAIMADARADVTVADCRITVVHSDGISYIEQSRGSVDDTQVTDAEHGIAVVSGADPLVRRCVFTGCRDTGINVHTQGLGRFEDCEVVRAGNVAVYSTTGGSPDVRGGRIAGGNVGIAVEKARGRFAGIDIQDLTSAALRLLDGATGEFSRIRVARCPSGLETRGVGTKAELTEVSFQDFSMAAVTVLGTSRATLRGSTAEQGLLGFAVGENGHLLMYDCQVKDVEMSGAAAFGTGNLLAKNLTVTGSRGLGLMGRDSAYLDVTNSAFIDTLIAGVSAQDSCGGQLVDCSVTSSQGVAVQDNGLIHLSSLRSSLAVIEQAPEPPPVPQTVVNHYHYEGPVFQAAVQGLQLAWNNNTVSQHQNVQPSAVEPSPTARQDKGMSMPDSYQGPVFHGDVKGAQLAWNNVNVTQNQQNSEQVAPGFEDVARVVANVLQRIAQLGLPEQDAQDATESANVVLAEVVRPEPDRGVIRRGLNAIKGTLSPLVAGLLTGAQAGSVELGKELVKELGQISF